MAQQEYYSFERVLKELQIEEEELKRLVSEGEIRAFRDEDKMKFKKSDIEGLKKGRMTEPTIILPSSEGGDSAEDSEVLLVEEETSETLLDIEDLESAESSSASVPTVDFSSSEVDTASSTPSTSGTITEELSFEEEDSGSYVLESSDDVLIDSSQDLVPVDDKPSSEETFIDDTGMQTEPLDMELDSSSDLPSAEIGDDEGEGLTTQPVHGSVPRRQMTAMIPMVAAAPASPLMVACLILTCLVLLFSGVVMLNTMRGIDTPITSWMTDMSFEFLPSMPSKDFNESKIPSHVEWRVQKREKPGFQEKNMDFIRKYLVK